MLAWSEGTDNGRQKTRNRCSVIVGVKLFTDYSDHPHKTCHVNPNSNQRAPDATSFFPVGGMPTASSLAWKTSLRKVRTLWHCSRLKAWRFTYDWSWWYPSGNRPLQQYLGFTAGRWLWSVRRHGLTAWLQNSKRAERSERLMYEQSHRDYLRSWLSASSSACHGLLIITIDNAITYKTARQKCQRTEAQRTRQLLTCRCVSVMLLRSMQNTRRS